MLLAAARLQEADKLRHLAEEDRAAALAERDEALAAKEAAERERQEVRDHHTFSSTRVFQSWLAQLLYNSCCSSVILVLAACAECVRWRLCLFSAWIVGNHSFQCPVLATPSSSHRLVLLRMAPHAGD